MTVDHDDLEYYYQLFNLTSDATVQEVDDAYFRLKRQKLRQGARQETVALKSAYKKLKTYLQQTACELASEQHDQDPEAASPIEPLLQLLQQQGFQAQIKVQNHQLHIGIKATQVLKPRTIVARLYTLLENLDMPEPLLADINTVCVYGLSSRQKAIWKRTFPMPRYELTAEDRDLFSFNNRFSNAITLPVIMVLSMVLNAMPMAKFLLRGINIWIHEFGHATVAWLAGRKAIPLPFGWTNVEPDRSIFVYFGLLILFGLLFWAGRREQRRWPMVLAVVFVLLQFCMTWLMPSETFQMLLAFGGIGGEFYLSALLMVSFYFPMPQYWQWEVWRYPVVLGAAFTFWGSLTQWRQIDRGMASIPWGSLWGGADHTGGDMNQLSLQYGWSDQQIIDTYNAIGGWCVAIVLGIYCYFLLKQNPALLFGLWAKVHNKWSRT